MIQWTSLASSPEADSRSQSQSALVWSAEDPAAICMHSSRGRPVGKDALGLKVLKIESLDDFQSGLLRDKIVILSLSDELSNAQFFVSKVREEFYSLCDSRLRPFCASTHRPYPLRDLPLKSSLSSPIGARAELVSMAIVDAGSLTRQANGGSGVEGRECLNTIFEGILKAGPALIIVCSDGFHWVEEVFGAHAQSLRGNILPLLMFSARMNFSAASSSDHIPHGARLLRDYDAALLQGKAILQLGVQRERNAQSDYDIALDHGVSVVEYLYLLGFWRNAMNGREVSPLEHVFDHLDKMTSLGWSKTSVGVHLAFSLDVIGHHWDGAFAQSAPFGCSMKDLGATLTYLGRTGLCKVIHLMGSTASHVEAEQSARIVGSLIYKLVLLREEYSGT